MKVLFAIISLFTFATSHAQVNQYDAPVQITLPNDTINGYVFIRKADFQELKYNRVNKSVTVLWTVYYYNTDTVQMPVEIMPPYSIYQEANESTFIQFPSGQTVAYSASELREKYGDTVAAELNIYDGYSFYNYAAEHFNIPINTLIKTAGTRAAAEGKLNR